MHWPGERTGIPRRGTGPSRETGGTGREDSYGRVAPTSGGNWGEPGPTGGKEGTDRRTGRGRHDGTQRSSKHVNGTRPNSRTGSGEQDVSVYLDRSSSDGEGVGARMGGFAEGRERGRGWGHVRGVRRARQGESGAAPRSAGE